MASLYLDLLAAFLAEAGNVRCDDNFADHVKQRIAKAESHPPIAGTLYRASSIGKPWILQVLDRWYGHKRSFSVSQQGTMLQGTVAQEFIAAVLSLGKFVYSQEVTLRYLGVTGHADFVVFHGEKHVTVLECKSMAPHLVAGFAANPHDDYGYLSQLSFYWHCVSRLYPEREVSAAFVLFNRGTSVIRTVPVGSATMRGRIERVTNALEVLHGIDDYDVDALLRNVAIPPCVNGKVPSSMRWSRWMPVLYAERSAGWDIQDVDAIARQLKALPLERADYIVGEDVP